MKGNGDDAFDPHVTRWLDAFGVHTSPAPEPAPEPAPALWLPPGADADADDNGPELLDMGALVDLPDDDRPYLVDDFLPSAGTSTLDAIPKAGKTTLAAGLAVAVAQGGTWLSRQCEAGPVLTLAFEEHPQHHRARLVALGALRDDPIYWHCGMLPGDVNGLEWLARQLDTYRPRLVIVDTLARLVRLTDGNDYAGVTRESEAFIQLARDADAHIMLVTHARKAGGDFGAQVLGSQAIAASVDVVLSLRRDTENGGARYIESQNRYGTAIEPTGLELDPDTGAIELAGHTRAKAKGVQLEQAVLDCLSGQSEPQLVSAIRQGVRGSNKAIAFAVQRLYRDGLIVSDGNARHPKYSVPDRPRPFGTAVPRFPPTGGGNRGTVAERRTGTADPMERDCE